MIDYRYISAIIYLVISSLFFASGNIAIGQETKKIQLDVREFVSSQDDSQPNLRSQSSIAERKSDRPTLKNTPSQRDSSDKISKQWSRVGIFGTSSLFILMIWILFKEDKRKLETAATPSTTALKKKQIDKPNEIADRSLTVDTEKPVEQASFPMIGMDFEPELDDEPKEIEAINPEMTIAEVSENIALDEDPIVDSDIMGKLTIVDSNTTETEIDVVSELILDLQKSNQIEDTVKRKDLKRKAIWELGQSNDFRAVEPLIQTIPKADSLEKSLILDAITQIANRSFSSINQALITSLEDDDAEVRKNAIQDLTSLYHSMSSITIRLSKMTGDRDLEVRQTAKWALEQFNQMVDTATSRENSNLNVVSDLGVDRRNGKSHY